MFEPRFGQPGGFRDNLCVNGNSWPSMWSCKSTVPEWEAAVVLIDKPLSAERHFISTEHT